MKQKIKTFIGLILLISSCAWAEETPQNNSKTTDQQDIIKLFKTTGLDQSWERLAAHSLESLKQRNPDISDAVWNKIIPKIDTNEYMELLIPVYEKYFTHDEVIALIEFYESPAGKKWHGVQQGILLEESGEALKSWREKKFHEIMKGLAEHKKQNSPNLSLQPTVKTPVESGNVQGTAGHF